MERNGNIAPLSTLGRTTRVDKMNKFGTAIVSVSALLALTACEPPEDATPLEAQIYSNLRSGIGSVNRNKPADSQDVAVADQANPSQPTQYAGSQAYLQQNAAGGQTNMGYIAPPYGPTATPSYQGTQGIPETQPLQQAASAIPGNSGAQAGAPGQFPPPGYQTANSGPSILGSIQPQYRLNDTQINKLFAGNTVYSTSVSGNNDRQVGFFAENLELRVSARGKRFLGSWFAYSNQLCYDLGGPAICSSVYMMPPPQPGKTPTYFFVREQGPEAGRPSVIVTGIQPGNLEKI